MIPGWAGSAGAATVRISYTVPVGLVIEQVTASETVNLASEVATTVLSGRSGESVGNVPINVGACHKKYYLDFLNTTLVYQTELPVENWSLKCNFWTMLMRPSSCIKFINKYFAMPGVPTHCYFIMSLVFC